MTFVHLPFLFSVSLPFFASHVFMRCTLYCVIRRNFKQNGAVRQCFFKFLEVIGLHVVHGYRCRPVASQSLTPLFKICHVLTICIGSFLAISASRYVLKSLSIGFRGKSLTFSERVLCRQ